MREGGLPLMGVCVDTSPNETEDGGSGRGGCDAGMPPDPQSTLARPVASAAATALRPAATTPTAARAPAALRLLRTLMSNFLLQPL